MPQHTSAAVPYTYGICTCFVVALLDRCEAEHLDPSVHAELFFTELLVPIYWIFKSQVKKHHRQVFNFVLQQHGLSPKKVPLQVL